MHIPHSNWNYWFKEVNILRIMWIFYLNNDSLSVSFWIVLFCINFISSNEHVWDLLKRDFFCFQSLQQPEASRERFLGQSIARCHSILLWPFPWENTCLRCDVLGTPYCDNVFHWSGFIIYAYNDKLPVTSLVNKMTLSLRVFSRQCICSCRL